ncbi:MAG TPA: SOS response-associated peptidase family protein [Tepidisphaeraceae bacterium]|jgi:putative SOS response-associated peptidase YedK|nr:SOS response-associated peptidase family protein [Tepidisphaeraceae bacterium]
MPARWKLETFTILTTEPNALMKPIHNRMPVIVPPSGYRRWLTGDEPQALLKPYDADAMEAFPISTRVNNVRNDGPELIERV